MLKIFEQQGSSELKNAGASRYEWILFQPIVSMQGFRHLCVHFRKIDNQYGTYGIVNKLDLSKFH